MHDIEFPPFPGLRPAAFEFLRGLAENNRRDWFVERKNVYTDEIQWPLRCLVMDVSARLAPTGLRLTADPGRSLFRIYRDTRFSANKDPYKTAQGAVLSPDGDHRSPGALYVHVEPRKCFVAAGFWMPSADLVRSWRRRMSDEPHRFLSIAEDLREVGLSLDREQPLKRLPRGFEAPADESLVEFLLLKSFTVSREIPDSALMHPGFADDFASFALDARPLLEFGWDLV